MKLCKNWRIIGLVLILLLSVSLPVFATDESIKNVEKGYLELKGTIPSWVTNDIVLSLRHENGSTEHVILYSAEQFENVVKLPVGKYVVEYVEAVGVPVSDYLVEFSHNLVIEKDKGTAYGIRILGRGAYAEENDAIGTPIKKSSEETEKQEKPPKTTDSNESADTKGSAKDIEKETAAQKNEDEAEGEVHRSLLGQPVGENTKKPSNNIDGFLNKVGDKGEIVKEINKMGDGQANQKKESEKKKDSWGMRFLKRNWLSFILLIVVCVATFIIKKRNDTL